MTFHGYESYPISIKALIIRKIAEILTNGNISIGKFIGKWYKTKADIVSYGAVKLQDFKLRNSVSRYDAIFVSRLDEHTGIITYLDTVQKLRDRGIDFSLLVLGEGKYYEAAEKTAIVKGFVKNPERYYKYAQFAFVSRYLAILEAFASRKLVFAVYDNPIKHDYLTMTPYKNWIIIEKDANKLANRIEYYKNNPKKAKEKIDIAYEWVQKQTWDKLSKDYLKLWGI
jgi:glycosyltransferase involved in cell wall biosynthesis